MPYIRLMTVLFLSVLMVAPAIAADEPVFSGPQAGEKMTSFKVVGVYDKDAGKELDFVSLADGKPTLLIFVHKLTRPGAALMRTLTSYAASQKATRGYIVWLNDDRAKAEAYLTRARNSLQFKVPVGVSLNGGEGPGAYGLNRNVELTILVAKDSNVTANFALVQPSVTEAPKIAATLAKLIDAKPPTQDELTKLAFPKGNMRGKPTDKKTDKQKGQPNNNRAKPAPVDPALGSLLRAMIQKDATPEGVAKAAADVEKFVGDDAAKRAAVLRISGVIVERKYGTEAAQKQATVWQRKYADSKEAKETSESKGSRDPKESKE